jgi:hypothetical protein
LRDSKREWLGQHDFFFLKIPGHQVAPLPRDQQEIETLVAFCVQQHYLLKFKLCHQERETLVAFCVQQHYYITFVFCSPVRKTAVIFDVQQNH